jgi:hypothetical protein
VTAQTLPLLFGVDTIAIAKKFEVTGTFVEKVSTPIGSLDETKTKLGYFLDDTANISMYALFSLLKEHIHKYRVNNNVPLRNDLFFRSARSEGASGTSC